MLKFSLKAVVLAVAAAVTLLAAGAVYFVVKDSSKEASPKSEYEVPLFTVAAEDASREAEEAADNIDCYIVRLEGESLGIYACRSGNEEFLYNEKVYTSNLPHEDIVMLSTGVFLKDVKELTGFIENFTS